MEEKKHVTCPSCDNKIEWFGKFPLVKINSFERITLPNLIKGPVEDVFPLQRIVRTVFLRRKIVQKADVPVDVVRELAEKDEYSYEGKIYRNVNIADIGGGWYAREDFFKFNPDASEEDLVRSIGFREFEPGIRVYKDFTEEVNKFLKRNEGILNSFEKYIGKPTPVNDIFDLLGINGAYPTSSRDFNFSIDSDISRGTLGIDSDRQDASDLGFGCYTKGYSLDIAKFSYEGLFREIDSPTNV